MREELRNEWHRAQEELAIATHKSSAAWGRYKQFLARHIFSNGLLRESPWEYFKGMYVSNGAHVRLAEFLRQDLNSVGSFSLQIEDGVELRADHDVLSILFFDADSGNDFAFRHRLSISNGKEALEQRREVLLRELRVIETDLAKITR